MSETYRVIYCPKWNSKQWLYECPKCGHALKSWLFCDYCGQSVDWHSRA